jgi:predicted nucleic acid-binding protein
MENITPPMPAKRALAALDQPAPAVPVPAKRISKKVSRSIDLMVTGECKTIKEAAEKVGLARESLSRALSTPHIAEYLRTKVLRSLAMAAARAGAVKVDLLDSDNAIARERASSFVLGLAGIAPAATPSVSLNLEIKAGYVIDLTDDRPTSRPMRIVSSTARPVAIDHDVDGDE